MGIIIPSPVQWLIFGCCFALSIRLSEGAWQDNIKPRRTVHLGDDDVFQFAGNETSEDFFKLVLPDSGYILVGGRNVVYNLSLHDLSEQNRVEWYPNADQLSKCYLKGGSDDMCQNYIRIIIRKADSEYLICGTNAYGPMCRDYKVQSGALEQENERSGRGLCPYVPTLNTTAVYAEGQLYVATIADFSGLEPLIYREPLRTEQYDLFTLNSPNFISSFALGDFVYFFFRESAVEYLNCGKTIYSRVARVCRHDQGGPHMFRNKWTSYLKSRLNCSVSGDYPFYFNEIQATTDPIEGRYGGFATTLLYGIFTTPHNSIPGSAICAFTFQDIMDTFEGPFKGKEATNSNWLPVKSSKVPEPRPGQCVKDSSTLPDVTLNFIKMHSLMDEAVPAFFGQPILIRTSFHNSGRLTSIAVDPQVKTPDGKSYDILYAGTDEGKVIKAINTRSADSYQDVDPFIIEELSVFPKGTQILSLKIVTSQKRKRLLVVSSSKVILLSLYRCGGKKSTCGQCVALQDPYCAWDKSTKTCTTVGSGKDLIQSVTDGTHSKCNSEKPSDPPSVNRASSTAKVGMGSGSNMHPSHEQSDSGEESNSPTTKSIPLQFTAETLAIAVASAAIGALILGFITGFFCGKKCNKEEENQLYAVTDYEYYDQRQNPNSRLTGDLQDEVTYAEPVLVPQSLNKPVNLVLNMSPKATLKNPANATGPLVGSIGGIGLGGVGTVGPPIGLAMPPATGPLSSGGPQDIPLHYTPESYSTHGTLRSSEKYGTRGREHRRDYDHRLGDGYATTRSVKKVYL